MTETVINACERGARNETPNQVRNAENSQYLEEDLRQALNLDSEGLQAWSCMNMNF